MCRLAQAAKVCWADWEEKIWLSLFFLFLSLNDLETGISSARILCHLLDVFRNRTNPDSPEKCRRAAFPAGCSYCRAVELSPVAAVDEQLLWLAPPMASPSPAETVRLQAIDGWVIPPAR